MALKENKGEYIKGKLHFQFKSDLMTAHGKCVSNVQVTSHM
jgi:hypothetical protein